MSILRTLCSLGLTSVIVTPGFSQPQANSTPAAPPRYQLTVVQNASGAKRVKKNRVSAEAVVEVTDQNNVPVAGIAVSFTIPQLVGGGASFATGGLTSVATTNAMGLASSGSFVAGGNSSFSMSAVASVPGGTVTVSIPVNATALLGAGAAGGAAAGGAAGGTAAGISTGLLVGIVAGVGAVAAVVAKVATGGKGTPATPPAPGTSIALGGATVGH
jgi:hypothetical protein